MCEKWPYISRNDSISEDVSSSVALSHDRISPGGEKESETSEDTVSASNPCPALEGSAAPTSDIPNKIRNLEEAFGSGRTLPFINPSSIETLRVLVREIQSSGETDPEIWKNCEGRWLHLFQLVEKQYQEQILAQQDQYQCQIQLIQDEIKALVQLQNHQISAQSHANKNLKPPPESRTPGPPSPPQLSLQPHESSEDGMMTVHSSGYGTISIWDHGLETGRSGSGDGLWSLNQQDGSLTPSPVPLTSPLGQNPLTDTLHTTAAVSPDLLTEKKRAMIGQPLTSWAQRPKHRKSRTTQIHAQEAEKTVQASSEDKSRAHACSEAAVSRLALNRSDSVASEASGFSYWKLEESELYRPLPDSLDTASFALQQPSSLKEIYQRKRPQVQPRPSSTGSTVDPVSHAGSLSAAEDEGSHTATLTVRPTTPSAQQAEDPIVLSLLRQRLREKHARHMTDLRTYYEAEISALKERLRLVHLPVDLEKSNRILQERCQQLEQTLTETSTRIRELEERNHHLEKQLEEWPTRYEAMSATVRVLQRHAEESQHSGREKDSTISKLKMRVRELEQALQKACREVEEKEHVMLQDLLREYDLLRTEHEGTKDKLKSTENKLLDADKQNSELKRLVLKLETQIRQLQHDNLPRTRQSPHRHSQPSGAGYWTPTERTSPCEDQRRDAPLSPSVKTLIQMEDSRATQGRALSRSDCMSSSLARRTPSVLMEEGSGGTLRARRSVSPEGHRSSSVPPRSQKSPAALTPTKRDTLLSPHSARSSPKRCPSENFSTALGRPLPSHEHLQKSPATRRRLHFTSPDTEKDEREEQEVADENFLSQSPALHSLADAERLFDELTQEKQQIEAALRRLPGGGAGARVTLQSRLDQVSLEKRLETVNRNLGFIRMTLKRFNVLRSSARM